MKSNGLGDALFYGGYDLSGDVGSVSVLRASFGELDVTGINKFAHERIAGIRDGQIDFKAWYNPSPGQEHPVLDDLDGSDVVAVYCAGTILGNPAAAIVAKEFDFQEARGATGSLEDSISIKSNGHGLNWGRQLTAGARHDAGATNGASIDNLTLPTAIGISSVSVANPTHIVTAAPHKLKTGDSVLIAGVTSTPTVNGRWTVTRIDATTFSIPVNVTVGAGAAGTVQQTSTDFGWNSYLNVFAFTGTDATVKLQDSADNVTFADLAGGAFAQVTTAPGAQRIAGAVTATVREYVRAVSVTSGGFASLTFAVSFGRYRTTVNT